MSSICTLHARAVVHPQLIFPHAVSTLGGLHACGVSTIPFSECKARNALIELTSSLQVIC